MSSQIIWKYIYMQIYVIIYFVVTAFWAQLSKKICLFFFSILTYSVQIKEFVSMDF